MVAGRLGEDVTLCETVQADHTLTARCVVIGKALLGNLTNKQIRNHKEWCETLFHFLNRTAWRLTQVKLLKRL